MGPTNHTPTYRVCTRGYHMVVSVLFIERHKLYVLNCVMPKSSMGGYLISTVQCHQYKASNCINLKLGNLTEP